MAEEDFSRKRQAPKHISYRCVMRNRQERRGKESKIRLGFSRVQTLFSYRRIENP